MKRSQSIRLVQMGAVALTLAACEERVEVGVFETVGQCIEAGNAAAQCETALEAAQEQHRQVAPRYANQQDCEAEFGASQCTPAGAAPGAEGAAPTQQAQAGFGGAFMPIMAGYMMGRMMSGGGATAQPLYRPAATAPGAASGWHTAAGAPVARSPGVTSVPRAIAQASPTARSGTIARGGFGARAAQFGGGGIG